MRCVCPGCHWEGETTVEIGQLAVCSGCGAEWVPRPKLYELSALQPRERCSAPSHLEIGWRRCLRCGRNGPVGVGLPSSTARAVRCKGCDAMVYDLSGTLYAVPRRPDPVEAFKAHCIETGNADLLARARVCAMCGKPLPTWLSPNAYHCGQNCRTRAAAARKRLRKARETFRT